MATLVVDEETNRSQANRATMSRPSPPADRSWQLRAACHDHDAELFFSIEPLAVQTALEVCASCEVRAACLQQAMAAREYFGVWGGTTETERRRVFRQQRRGTAA